MRSAKIPAVIHGAITNLVIFHKFLEENSGYRASQGKEIAAVPATGDGMPPVLNTEEAVPEEEKGDEEEEDGEQGDSFTNNSLPISDWGLDFTPLIEEELMAGHVPRQRILSILDHPNLTNHLLGTKNLLILLVSVAHRSPNTAMLISSTGLARAFANETQSSLEEAH